MKKTLILILCGLILLVACGKKENVETDTKVPDKTVVQPEQAEQDNKEEASDESVQIEPEKNEEKTPAPAQTEQEKKKESVAPSPTTAPDKKVKIPEETEPSNNTPAENPSDEASDTDITAEDISSFLRGHNPGLIDKVNGNNN